MKKKLQIFVSSTYLDLREERQAAVEAILAAGHIPAGMELFAAGNDSQLATINRWIEDSDILMLILGGRYGTIEKNSGLSYIELEYRYACDKGIPVFAVVMSDNMRKEKVRIEGEDVIETRNSDKYNAFKELVKSRMCQEFDDPKDIQLAVHRSLLQLTSDHEFVGWISVKEIEEDPRLLKKIIALEEEKNDLRNKVEILEKRRENIHDFGGFSFQDLNSVLSSELVDVPKELNSGLPTKISLLNLFITYQGPLIAGIISDPSANFADGNWIFKNLATRLYKYGLTEKVELPGTQWFRFQVSENGARFLTMLAFKKTTAA